MDRETFVRDLETAVKRLPKTILDDVAILARKIIGEHRQAIEVAVPAVVEDLKNHIAAIGFEKAMGVLNTKEVEADVMSVLEKVGIKEEPTPSNVQKVVRVAPTLELPIDTSKPVAG